MRVVVTGGGGQLGSLVLRRLIDDRAVTAVRCLDVRPPLLVADKLDFLEADVRDSRVGFWLEGFDALVHLAAVRREDDPVLTRSVNVGGSRNVLEAALRAGIHRVVYGSSLAAYGLVHGHRLPLTEETPRRRQSDFTYAASRYDAEAFLDTFEPRHPELCVTRLRPSVLVGARMEHPVGDRFRRRVVVDAESSPIPVVWDEDVADAVMLALKQDGVCGAFNLSADEPLAPHEFARLASLQLVRVPRELAVTAARVQPFLARLTGTQAMDPAWARVFNIPMTVSCERARSVLGWHPHAPTARKVWKFFAESAPHRTDDRIWMFIAAVNLARWWRPLQGPIGQDARIHLALTGVSGGDFTLEVRDGRARILREAPRPPTATIELSAVLFLDLLAGRADLEATERTGRIRVVRDGWATRILDGMISSFRETVACRETVPSRWVENWLAR